MNEVIERCRLLAEFSEEPGFTTRTFLSPPMHEVHAQVRTWMEQAGMTVAIDHVGNIRGVYPADRSNAPRLFIGSHLDTVPRAGAFDGILGVVLPVTLIERLAGRRLPFAIEVIGFSEEEGVRYGVPFIGSRALIGDIDSDLLTRIGPAITSFGLDAMRIGEARAGDNALGYLEFHIEQGPVLESLGLPLGVVDAIAGQSRLDVVFQGQANHAGTTPMNLRRDALAGAAEWISTVEREARAMPGAVATVGRIAALPGAGNVIPGSVTTSLDVRHTEDAVRHHLVARLLAMRRADCFRPLPHGFFGAAPGSTGRRDGFRSRARCSGARLRARDFPVHRMASGAGHDAMIVARRMPAAMLFLRSPGGISHHPDETVLTEDVDAALDVGMRFLEALEQRHA